MHDLKIEKGVPLPTKARGGWGKFLGLEKIVEVGDSWVLTDAREKGNCRAYLQRRGFKVIQRKEGDAWRLWVTGKKESTDGS